LDNGEGTVQQMMMMAKANVRWEDMLMQKNLS
jgi:hypothetical protein